MSKSIRERLRAWLAASTFAEAEHADPLLLSAVEQHVGAQEQRIATLEAALRPFAATSEEVLRCEHCGWPIVPKHESGCWESNCSQRPMPAKRSDLGSANDRVRARLALEAK